MPLDAKIRLSPQGAQWAETLQRIADAAGVSFDTVWTYRCAHVISRQLNHIERDQLLANVLLKEVMRHPEAWRHELNRFAQEPNPELGVLEKM
jgi:hypothetical protein